MPRRKVPATATGATTGGVFLDDDEQLVEEVTTTKKIGRQRRTPPAEAEPIAAEPVFVDETDEDDEIEQPAFSQTSLAAMIYGEDGETFEDKFCTVAVRRKPDTMRDKFAVPCSAVTNLPRLSNIALTTEQADIEDQVRSEYGGGHYFFQIWFEGRLGRTWQATLSDLPGWKPPTAETQHEATTAAAPAAVVNPMDSFIESLTKTQQLKALLFGDEQKRYEEDLRQLRAELEAARNTKPAEPISEELVMWRLANEMPDSEAKTRLLDKLMPTDADGNTPWYVDAAKLALENKDAIVGVIGSLFGSLAPQPAQPANIADMMRAPAPSLPPRPSVFKKPEPAPTEPPPPADTFQLVNADGPQPTGADLMKGLKVTSVEIEPPDITKGDDAAIDAEVVNEKEPKKNERRKRSTDKLA